MVWPTNFTPEEVHVLQKQYCIYDNVFPGSNMFALKYQKKGNHFDIITFASLGAKLNWVANEFMHTVLYICRNSLLGADDPSKNAPGQVKKRQKGKSLAQILTEKKAKENSSSADVAKQDPPEAAKESNDPPPDGEVAKNSNDAAEKEKTDAPSNGERTEDISDAPLNDDIKKDATDVAEEEEIDVPSNGEGTKDTTDDPPTGDIKKEPCEALGAGVVDSSADDRTSSHDNEENDEEQTNVTSESSSDKAVDINHSTVTDEDPARVDSENQRPEFDWVNLTNGHFNDVKALEELIDTKLAEAKQHANIKDHNHSLNPIPSDEKVLNAQALKIILNGRFMNKLMER